MSQITVRQATLNDTAAITAVHTSYVTRWQRLDAQGRVQDVPYEALTVYERWLHGGPWMSVEMCAVQLTHLQRGAGMALVAERDGAVLAEAEVFYGVEPPPFGEHLSVSVLYTHDRHHGEGLGSALLAQIVALARERGCQQVSIPQVDAPEFYAKHGFAPAGDFQWVSFPARTGQVFYQAMPHLQDDPAQVRGWMMPLGRAQSAHQQWVTLWPNLWAAVPEFGQRRAERLKFTMAGNTCFVLYAESRHDPRLALVYVWTPKPLTGPMITALSDRAHKLGFRRLQTYVQAGQEKLLGPEMEVEGPPQPLYRLDLASRAR